MSLVYNIIFPINVCSKLIFRGTSFLVDKIIKDDSRLSCDSKHLFLFLTFVGFQNAISSYWNSNKKIQR